MGEMGIVREPCSVESGPRGAGPESRDDSLCRRLHLIFAHAMYCGESGLEGQLILTKDLKRQMTFPILNRGWSSYMRPNA